MNIFLKFKKVTKKEFSDKTNRNINTLSKMFQLQSEPKLTVLQDVLKVFPEVNARWLILEEGKPFEEKKISSSYSTRHGFFEEGDDSPNGLDESRKK